MKNAEVISHQALRRLVGLLGTTLPFVLLWGGMLSDTKLQSSVSAYYHTYMRDYFVGLLFAIGVFLVSYRGYRDSFDNVMTSLAGGFAIGVALFPTGTNWIGYVHWTLAAAFLSILAVMSFFFFTKSDVPAKNMSAEKKQRNLVYRVCGFIIILCLVLILVHSFIVPLGPVGTVFVLEAVALVAFGFSWLVKGDTMWRDASKCSGG